MIDEIQANPGGMAHIALRDIANELGIDPKTAQRAIADLETAGAVVRHDRGVGRVAAWRLGMNDDEAPLFSPTHNRIGSDKISNVKRDTPPKIDPTPTSTPDKIVHTTPDKIVQNPGQNSPMQAHRGGEYKGGSLSDSAYLPAEGRKEAPRTEKSTHETLTPEQGKVWHALAMAGIGEPSRSQFARVIPLPDAKAVIDSGKQRQKPVALIVLDLRDRIQAVELRARNKAEMLEKQAANVHKAQESFSAKNAVDDAQRAALVNALEYIAACTDRQREDAAVHVLESMPRLMRQHILARSGNPQTAAVNPRMAVAVAARIRECIGVHVAPLEPAI